MNKHALEEKTVVVVGGGVAGMSAARHLAQHHINVHLVEKSPTLGGNASLWACMATDTCQNCGACLSQELAQSVANKNGISLHLNQQVTAIEKNEGSYSAILDPDSPPLKADHVILASGFSAFRPDGLLGQACDAHPGVITTNQLNHLLTNQNLDRFLTDKESPRIAFLQCVGSRNREKKRDFCSQVCCKISLRHINKILHMIPGADVTMFYMDLQVIGKEARTEFGALKDNIRLVQGVPAEILKGNPDNPLTLIHENPDSMARAASHFDLVVLSVGLHAQPGTAGMVQGLDLPVNDWGFLTNGIPGSSGQSSDPGILVAGCADGPKDIITSVVEGENCAHRIIQSAAEASQPSDPFPVAVMGDGHAGIETAHTLSALGFDPWVFGQGHRRDLPATLNNYIPDSRVVSVTGYANQYLLTYTAGDEEKKKSFSLSCRAIILAGEDQFLPAGNDLGIKSDKILSLEGFASTLDTDPEMIPDKLAFWQDFSGPESKQSSRQLLLLATRAAKLKKTVTVFMEKMLVHGMDGQRLYDEARKNGVKFLRINTPDDIQAADQSDIIQFTVKEVSLKGMAVSVESQWLILPDRSVPDVYFDALADLVNEPLDREGGLQSPNIRHRLTGSFRKGVFYTGTGHDDVTPDDVQAELLNICARLWELKHPQDPADPGVVINEKKCAKCLTCLRVCPHSAIRINNGVKPAILPEACYACGLCVANCPALAIEKTDHSDDEMIAAIQKGQCVVFACQRSAALAAKTVFENGTLGDQDCQVIEVPCACRISTGLVLKSLARGPEKVILAGCHEGNCQSHKGSSEAQDVARFVNSLPGIRENQSVFWTSAAANEGGQLLNIIQPS